MLDLRDQIKVYFDETAPPVEPRTDISGTAIAAPERTARLSRRPILVASLAFAAVLALIVLPLLLSRRAEPPPVTQLPAPPTTTETIIDGGPSNPPTVAVPSVLQPLDLATVPAVEPPNWTAVAAPPGWGTAPWTLDRSAGDAVAFLTFPDEGRPEPVVLTEDGVNWTASVTHPAPDATAMGRQSDGIWLGANRGRDRYFSIDGRVWEPIAYRGQGDVAIADDQLIVVDAGEGRVPSVLAGPTDDPNPTLETTLRGVIDVDGPVLIDAGVALVTRHVGGEGVFVGSPGGEWAAVPLPSGTERVWLDAGRIYALVEGDGGFGRALFWSTGNDAWTELIALQSAELGNLDAVEDGVAMIVTSTAPDATGTYFIWAGNDGTLTWRPVEPGTRIAAANSFVLRWTFDPDSFAMASTPGRQ